MVVRGKRQSSNGVKFVAEGVWCLIDRTKRLILQNRIVSNFFGRCFCFVVLAIEHWSLGSSINVSLIWLIRVTSLIFLYTYISTKISSQVIVGQRRISMSRRSREADGLYNFGAVFDIGGKAEEDPLRCYCFLWTCIPVRVEDNSNSILCDCEKIIDYFLEASKVECISIEK